MSTADKRIVDEFLNKYSKGKQRIEDVFKNAEDESKFISDLAKFTLSELIKHNMAKFKEAESQGKPIDTAGQVIMNSAYMTVFIEQFTNQWNSAMTSVLGKIKIEKMKRQMDGLHD